MARKLPKMASMELEDEDKLDAAMPIPMNSKPDFPYGLQICLTDKELHKLGVDPAEAEVGGYFVGCFIARITCISSNETEGSAHLRLEAQIEDLCIEGAGDAKADDADADEDDEDDDD